MEKLTLVTKDKLNIAAEFYGGNSMRGIILLHMMPATKESWREFAQKLQFSGVKALAIDLRGHGESTDGPVGYKSFGDEEHQASMLDVEATVDFLQTRGVGDLSIAGASIGANLAIWYASKNPFVKRIILLSPGLNYRGIKTEEFAPSLREDQSIYYVASEKDNGNYGSAADMARKLYGLTKANKSIKIFKDDKHGTDMLENNTEFQGELTEWLKK